MEINGMLKTCFTINQNRTTEEFLSYEKLIQDNLFQAVEIFYPYNKTLEEQKTYEQNAMNLMKYNIAICGTFNVDNYGDVMFPEVFKRAMKKLQKSLIEKRY